MQIGSERGRRGDGEPTSIATALPTISVGCINVPPDFYEDVVEPLFEPADGVGYILPEM